MSALEAMLLGLVQGLTEFFPVSSSGHLVIFQRLLAVEAPIELGLARRVVGSALGRPPGSLSDPLVVRDLRRSGEPESGCESRQKT